MNENRQKRFLTEPGFHFTVCRIIIACLTANGISFSEGSFLVLAATIGWGLENNCTRQISSKSTYEIVMLKGFFSGVGSLIIAFISGERVLEIKLSLAAMALGFAA